MFCAVGPPAMPPYGPDMYWQGPQMPQHGRPFPVPYGEGMYGPGPMPFDGPMMPPGPYNMGPYMPPMYPAAPMHGYNSFPTPNFDFGLATYVIAKGFLFAVIMAAVASWEVVCRRRWDQWKDL
jgi:hypothetical protein